MKNLKNILIIILSVLVLTNCKKDDDAKPEKNKIRARFGQAEYLIKENQKTLKIPIVTDTTYGENLVFKIKVMTTDLDHPAELNTNFKIIEAPKTNTKIAYLDLSIIDDNKKNEPRQVYLDLIETEQYSPDKIARCKLTILDDDLNSVSDDHPLKKMQGYYKAEVTHKSEDSEKFYSGDPLLKKWDMTIEIEDDSYNTIYISGIHGSPTKVPFELVEDVSKVAWMSGSNRFFVAPKLSRIKNVFKGQIDLGGGTSVLLDNEELVVASNVIYTENGTEYEGVVGVFVEEKADHLYIQDLMIGYKAAGKEKPYLLIKVSLKLTKL
ncbi:MAG: hypothetical protein MI739_12615 [Bacteroidales bacterium]|nr:hypothetical protein [Bacteroidales bacterium]